MTHETSSMLERTRNEALRALIGRAGLSPRQVAALKLDQLHLAQSTLTVEPDEDTALRPAAPGAMVTVKLDSETQRLLLAWLVVRPDSPNEHLFPGDGLAALDLATIQAVLTAEGEPPAADQPAAAPASQPPRTLPEPIRPAAAEAAAAGPGAPEAQPAAEPAQSASLQEIEALRRELAEAEREKAPPRSVPPAPVRQAARPAAAPAGQPETGTRPTPKLVTPRRTPELSAPGAPRRPTPAAPRPEAAARPPEAARRAVSLPAAPPAAEERRLTLQLSYRTMTLLGAVLALICCVALAAGGYLSWQAGGVTNLVAQVLPAATPTRMATPSALPVSPVNTPTPLPSPTFTSAPPPTPPAGETPPAPPPTEPVPTPTPIIIVVTATPVPATETPTPTPTEAVTQEATQPPVSPEESEAPASPEEETQPPSAGEEEATATPTPGFKYEAPKLLEPENNARVQDRLLILKWEPIWTMEPGEYFAVRLRYKVQGAYEYAGDQVTAPEWRLPDILYYKADGPELQYEWWVYVERKNDDGSVTQLSPESEHRVFSWY